MSSKCWCRAMPNGLHHPPQERQAAAMARMGCLVALFLLRQLAFQGLPPQKKQFHYSGMSTWLFQSSKSQILNVWCIYLHENHNKLTIHVGRYTIHWASSNFTKFLYIWHYFLPLLHVVFGHMMRDIHFGPAMNFCRWTGERVNGSGSCLAHTIGTGVFTYMNGWFLW